MCTVAVTAAGTARLDPEVTDPVPAKRRARDPLFTATWVHVFEEDSAEGAVYRAEGDAIPLSRRPRERLSLRRDGSASVWLPGPDDRGVEQPAAWREEGGAIVVRLERGSTEWRIVERSAARLLVHPHRAG